MIIVTMKYNGYKKFKLDMTKEQFEQEYVETGRSLESDANPFDDSVDEWIADIQEMKENPDHLMPFKQAIYKLASRRMDQDEMIRVAKQAIADYESMYALRDAFIR